MNLKTILEKAKHGAVERSELQYVVETIENGKSLYTCLHIIGKAKYIERKDVVEKLVFYAKDPMVAGLALKVLISDFGLLNEHCETLFEFLEGVPWDDEFDLRLAAISIVSRNLEKLDERRIMPIMFRILEDDGISRATREAIIPVLLLYLGKDWPFIVEKTLDIDERFLHSIGQTARERFRLRSLH